MLCKQFQKLKKAKSCHLVQAREILGNISCTSAAEEENRTLKLENKQLRAEVRSLKAQLQQYSGEFLYATIASFYR